MLSFYKIVVPNDTCPAPQITSPKHPGIIHVYIYICTFLYTVRNLSYTTVYVISWGGSVMGPFLLIN